MKHLISIPPIEWEIKLTCLPPEALYAVSSFALRPFINLSILQGKHVAEVLQKHSEKGKRSSSIHCNLSIKTWITYCFAGNHNRSQIMWYPSYIRSPRACWSYHGNGIPLSGASISQTKAFKKTISSDTRRARLHKS